MKRTNHNPIILPLPTFDMHSFAAQPRILPFPTRASAERQPGEQSRVVKQRVKKRRIEAGPTNIVGEAEPTEAALAEVRDRLFRMIVANEWDRNHGNRAS
jgi:hypothetical protein